MKKLINGIVEFRQKVQKDYREAFGRLATGQSPDTLFIACSDSRVVPNTFASTNPGDLFVLRNVGNLVPPCDQHGISLGDEAEAAAIEFAMQNLKISDIVVCGHSECGAMRALLAGRNKLDLPNLRNWLRHADTAIERLHLGLSFDKNLSAVNQLSQINVLLQMDHIESYPAVHNRLKEGSLGIHGWWFDIKHADVHAFDPDQNRFVLIDEEAAAKIIARMQNSTKT